MKGDSAEVVEQEASVVLVFVDFFYVESFARSLVAEMANKDCSDAVAAN